MYFSKMSKKFQKKLLTNLFPLVTNVKPKRNMKIKKIK